MVARRILSGVVIGLTWVVMAAFVHAEDEVGDGARIIDAKSQSERGEIVDAFKADLKRIGYNADIQDCAVLIDFFKNMPSGKDWSIGAVCRVKAANKSLNLMMCDDRLVGKFTLAPGIANRDELGDFVGKNCPPGG